MGIKRTLRRSRQAARWRTLVASSLLVSISLTGGCFLDNEVEQYYGRAVPPRALEFRWSDGGLPQVFDPALAAVPPDTDAVRAMFEGLTENDPKTLAPIPGVAARWESSDDGRQWTFYLRRNARWSNGEPVTARDFVRSWQRTLQLGDRAPYARLLENIEGVAPQRVLPAAPAASPEQSPAPANPKNREEKKKEEKREAAPPSTPAFGAIALDDYTLRVRLQRPDQSFPALVAHPVFRPVHDSGDAVEATAGNAAGSAAASAPAASQRLISNGAFQLSKVGGDGVVLERARSYWDAQAVSLQRVQFMPARDAESALASYHAGEIDAVTNAGFEPLALKLLAPYRDFHRATYGALTYYSFNVAQAPFNDVRVREALAIAVDRDRISEDQMGGATEPAKRFLPAQMQEMAGAGDAAHAPAAPIERNVTRAQRLLAEAGYPGGENFPKLRLLINRNEQQRQVALAVASMWQSALGIETEIILKGWEEYEAAVRAGEYDVVRRSVVMQTADETICMREIFEPSLPLAAPGAEGAAAAAASPAQAVGIDGKTAAETTEKAKKEGAQAQAAASPAEPPPVITEAQALRELPAMPIYFASSYALVKPYVIGFDSNLLDAPSLKQVRIDTAWQQPKQTSLIWFKSGE
ncbi:MAG TPA: peptide ABC transporter substrate-binding protein [Pyrinomonadaceae bacterium]|jgi:oligopeptide transport system substrate-binding protein